MAEKGKIVVGRAIAPEGMGGEKPTAKKKVETVKVKKEKTERERVRRVNRKREVVSVAGVGVLVVTLVALLVVGMKNLTEIVNRKAEDSLAEVVTVEPTIEIYDEGAGTSRTEGVSARVKEYVGLIERDLEELGVKATRAVLPAGKMREIDIYLEGSATYYKVSIDRGAGVSAEDIVRMKKYLEEQG